ncbi:hypothetical protein N7540_004576 [Penicillium herquei]|nr:hypothetical protein N7540_004576 [Penicillium herquei]
MDFPEDLEPSPVAAASSKGDESMVQLLIEMGADVNIHFDGRHGSALEAALSLGNEWMVQLLLEKGADFYGDFLLI